jgi:hypothetical protein
VEDLLLLQLVCKVAILADPARPGEVSQLAWDEARSTLDSPASGGPSASDPAIPSLPSSARSIARSLKRPWREVLEIAHDSPAWAKRLGADEAKNASRWLTAEHVAYVLKLAARRRGALKLTKKQYENERRLMIEENRRYYLHGRRLRLPTADQLCLFTQREIYGANGVGVPDVGTWDRALELAGLDSARRGRRRTTAQPLPLLDLLDRYCVAYGSEPTPRRLWRFAEEQKLPYVKMSSKRAWTEVILLWRRRREAEGLSAPRAAEPATAGENALAGMRLPTKPKKPRTSAWSDPEKCLQAITRYLEQIPKGKRANVVDYSAWASQHGRGPSVPTLKQHGGWTKMRQIAHERMLKELRVEPNQVGVTPPTSDT